MPVNLQDMIFKIKDELLAPNPRRRLESGAFALDEVEIEVAVVAAREQGGSLKLSVLELGEKASESETQKVRIVLKPVVKEEVIEVHHSSNRRSWSGNWPSDWESREMSL